MAITKEIIQDKIEILGDGKDIQVRTATVIKEDGVELTRSFHRHVVSCVNSVKNDDDSFTVAYKTVRALTASVGHNKTFKAALIDDGITFQPSSSLGENMTIGSSFRIRSTPTYTLPNDYLLSSSGFFTITSLNSGSVATPDFSGTEVQVDGMQVGTSLMVGGGSGSHAFAHNLIQTGSGFLNQVFFEGFPIPAKAVICLFWNLFKFSILYFE